MLDDLLDVPGRLRWIKTRPPVRLRVLPGLSPFAAAWIEPGQAELCSVRIARAMPCGGCTPGWLQIRREAGDDREQPSNENRPSRRSTAGSSRPRGRRSIPGEQTAVVADVHLATNGPGARRATA